MKRMFLLGVVGYSVISLLLQHWPHMALNAGAHSAPFLVMMVIDLAFAAAALFKLVGPNLFHDEGDEVSIKAEDVHVPDAWFYGLFGVNLVGNALHHGWGAVMETGALSVYNSIWFLVEAAALFLTFVFFKHAQRIANRKTATSRLARAA